MPRRQGRRKPGRKKPSERVGLRAEGEPESAGSQPRRVRSVKAHSAVRPRGGPDWMFNPRAYLAHDGNVAGGGRGRGGDRGRRASVLLEGGASDIRPGPMRENIRLVSTAGTGFTYYTTKNKRTQTNKLELKKYDPVKRAHVVFKETKMPPHSK